MREIVYGEIYKGEINKGLGTWDKGQGRKIPEELNVGRKEFGNPPHSL
jgi:hypothetical protein